MLKALKKIPVPPAALPPSESRVKHRAGGFSLIEMLVAMTIFSILMSVAFSAYQSQLRLTTREYASTSGEMDLLVVRNLIVRDLELGGYGLSDDPPVVPYVGANGSSAPDTLVIRGTALGLNNRGSQGWSYIDSAGNFPLWGDATEDLNFSATKAESSSFILLEPNTRQLRTHTSGADVYFQFYTDGIDKYGLHLTAGDLNLTLEPDLWTQGTLLYGLTTADNKASQPYWAVGYHLASAANLEDRCAPDGGTDEPKPRRLLRVESLSSASPLSGGDPVASCVLDFQVAFGLDPNEDGSINVWDNGGAELAGSGWSIAQIKKRLRQIRVYMLVQAGGLDQDGYTYPSATVRVGDDVAGRDLTLTTEQRKYRWKLLTMIITPRNLR